MRAKSRERRWEGSERKHYICQRMRVSGKTIICINNYSLQQPEMIFIPFFILSSLSLSFYRLKRLTLTWAGQLNNNHRHYMW